MTQDFSIITVAQARGIMAVAELLFTMKKYPDSYWDGSEEHSARVTRLLCRLENLLAKTDLPPIDFGVDIHEIPIREDFYLTQSFDELRQWSEYGPDESNVVNAWAEHSGAYEEYCDGCRSIISCLENYLKLFEGSIFDDFWYDTVGFQVVLNRAINFDGANDDAVANAAIGDNDFDFWRADDDDAAIGDNDFDFWRADDDAADDDAADDDAANDDGAIDIW